MVPPTTTTAAATIFLHSTTSFVRIKMMDRARFFSQSAKLQLILLVLCVSFFPLGACYDSCAAAADYIILHALTFYFVLKFFSGKMKPFKNETMARSNDLIYLASSLRIRKCAV